MSFVRAAVAAMALAAAAGCGGVESEPNLAEAAEKTEARGSFAFEVTARASDGESFSGMCDGVVDNVRELGRATCESDADSAFGAFEAIIVGDTSYRKDRGEQEWAKQPAADESPLAQFSPSQVLELLRSASSKTERVGEEDVRGESTVRHALTVDCEQAELYVCDSAVVDVWIDDEGLVRRVRMEEIRNPLDLEFFDFGVRVDVQPPPPEQVEESPRVDPVSCTTQQAGPISAGKAIDALRRHGFEVDPLALACSEGVAGYVGTRASATREVVGGAGYLACVVLDEDSPVGSEILEPGIAAGGVSLPAPEQRDAENLQCSLYADGPRADERVQALEAALAELKR